MMTEDALYQLVLTILPVLLAYVLNKWKEGGAAGP